MSWEGVELRGGLVCSGRVLSSGGVGLFWEGVELRGVLV